MFQKRSETLQNSDDENDIQERYLESCRQIESITRYIQNTLKLSDDIPSLAEQQAISNKTQDDKTMAITNQSSTSAPDSPKTKSPLGPVKTPMELADELSQRMCSGERRKENQEQHEQQLDLKYTRAIVDKENDPFVGCANPLDWNDLEENQHDDKDDKVEEDNETCEIVEMKGLLPSHHPIESQSHSDTFSDDNCTDCYKETEMKLSESLSTTEMGVITETTEAHKCSEFENQTPSEMNEPQIVVTRACYCASNIQISDGEA